MVPPAQSVTCAVSQIAGLHEPCTRVHAPSSKPLQSQDLVASAARRPDARTRTACSNGLKKNDPVLANRRMASGRCQAATANLVWGHLPKHMHRA